MVVRARNEAPHLPRLIEGLSKQNLRPDEVVLVDSGSRDSTVEIAVAAGWKVVHLDAEDFSFGRSLNKGFEACSAEIVVIISAHVYPTRSDFLTVLTRRVAPGSKVIAYGKQIGDHRTKFSEKVLMSTWFPSERIPDQGHAFTNNANACVPLSLWKDLRYNEKLTGLEDIDFSMRVLALGGSVVYEDEAEIVHVHEETYSQIANRYRREAVAYKAIFAGERMTLLSAVKLAIRNIWRDLALAVSQKELIRVWLSVVLFRLAQFYGAWRGFRETGSPDSDLMKRMYHPPSPGHKSREIVSAHRIEYSRDEK